MPRTPNASYNLSITASFYLLRSQPYPPAPSSLYISCIRLLLFSSSTSTSASLLSKIIQYLLRYCITWNAGGSQAKSRYVVVPSGPPAPSAEICTTDVRTWSAHICQFGSIASGSGSAAHWACGIQIIVLR